MKEVKVNKDLFKFNYLPQYAKYLLNNHLEEFVTIGIRFARELDLPILKPLTKVPEKELVKHSMDSSRVLLTALEEDKIASHVEDSLNKWIANKLEIIDKAEIAAEDLTLVYHIRRKQFSYFLYRYTQSAPIQASIFNEVDVYTSMEELASLKIYFEMIKKK